ASPQCRSSESSVAIVVLPQPDTPMTTRTEGRLEGRLHGAALAAAAFGSFTFARLLSERGPASGRCTIHEPEDFPDRAQASGRHGVVAAKEAIENRALPFALQEQHHDPAAFERRIG